MPIALLLLVVTAFGQPGRVSLVFDNETARQVMELRRQYDAAELAAIREFDAAMGDAKARIAVPTDRYEGQVAPPAVINHKWTEEQKRRSAKAWPAREQKVSAAEATLSARTVVLLKAYGYTEKALPSIRRRKWDGPAIHAYNSSVSPESRVLLQEVRRLWTLSGRPAK